MSLIAANASRHLRRHVLSNAAPSPHLRIGHINVTATYASNNARHLSSAKGGGLRRTQNKGPRRTTTPKATQSSSSAGSSEAAAAGPSSQQQVVDPHSIANEMVSSAVTAEARTSGVESLSKLTNEQRMSNFAMAGGLMAFVSYIFYYSLASVGGGENAKNFLFGSGEDDATKQQRLEGEGATTPGFEEFLKEANEGRSLEEKRLKAEKDARGEARELAELESSTAARLKAEGVGEDVIVAGSANEDEEREMARVAGFVDGEEGSMKKKKRPLWKRVLFFWRRE